MSAEYTDAEKLAILENPDDPRHAGLLDALDSTSNANAPDENAPFGYMIDPNTGERRAKKRPGRQRVSTPEPVRDAADEPRERVVIDREPDRAPDRRGRKNRKPEKVREEVSAPPFRAGPIAKGMNGLYKKAGKIIRFVDPDVGNAVIACTRKLDEDDVTVGEAWEELARTNPRVRAFLLKLLTGGATMQLFVAHLPILMAILMKDSIRSKIPFMGAVTSLMSDEDDEPQDLAPGGLEDLMSGLTQEDLAGMMNLANGLMGGMAGNLGRNGTRAPTYEEIEVEDE